MMSGSVPAELFSFYLPFSQETNPAVGILETGTLSWAEKFDLCRGDAQAATLYALTGANFMAHVYPHANGDLAQALSDYSAWGFAVNDQAFTTGQTSWLLDQSWEASLRERGAELTVNEYLAMRIGAGGVYAAISYIDAVEGIEVSGQELASPIVRAAVEAGKIGGGVEKKPYSFIKESRPRSKKYNIFDALRYDNPSLSPQQAILDGIAIRDRLLVLYTRLCNQILPHASEELRQYFIGADRIIS